MFIDYYIIEDDTQEYPEDIGFELDSMEWDEQFNYAEYWS